MILNGKITTGIGTAKMWVGKIEKTFKEKTNMNIFHGTLNIQLKDDYIILPDFVILPNEYGGTQKVLVKKCKILGNEAFIVRAEKNQMGNGDHNLKTIEIVSEVNFREEYKLKDDEKIEVNIYSN